MRTSRKKSQCSPFSTCTRSVVCLLSVCVFLQHDTSWHAQPAPVAPLLPQLACAICKVQAAAPATAAHPQQQGSAARLLLAAQRLQLLRSPLH